MINKKILLILRGFLVVLFMWLFSVDSLLLSTRNVFVAMLFCIGFSCFHGNIEKRSDRFLLFSLPIVYCILLFFTVSLSSSLAYQYLAFFFLITCLCIFKLNQYRIFLLVALAYTYVFGLGVYIPKWIERNSEKVVFEAHEEDKKKEEPVVIRLQDFSFLSSAGDSILLHDKSKYFILETWAEWCGPCKIAVKEMHSYFEANKQHFNHKLVYSDRKYSRLKDPSKIWTFFENVPKEKIIVDTDRSLSKAIGSNALPIFFVFDKQGELVKYIKGFESRERLAKALDKYKT